MYSGAQVPAVLTRLACCASVLSVSFAVFFLSSYSCLSAKKPRYLSPRSTSTRDMADRDEHPGAMRHRSVREELPLLAVDPSGRWCALVHTGELRLLPLVPSPVAAPATPPLSASAVECVRFDRTGALLLSGGGDKQVRFWDTATQTCTRTWTHGKKIACVEFSADAGVAMWADRFGEVYVVSLREPDAVPSLALGHLSPVSHLRLTTCGTALLTADREGHVRNSVWPHAFVINNYYLGHTLPLQIVLPMVPLAPFPALPGAILAPPPPMLRLQSACNPVQYRALCAQATSPLLLTCANGGADCFVWKCVRRHRSLACAKSHDPLTACPTACPTACRTAAQAARRRAAAPVDCRVAAARVRDQ